MVQDRCDRKQTLQKQILLVFAEWEWFRIDVIGNNPANTNIISVGGAVVQDRCDWKQTLQTQILLVLVEQWFRIDVIGNKP